LNAALYQADSLFTSYQFFCRLDFLLVTMTGSPAPTPPQNQSLSSTAPSATTSSSNPPQSVSNLPPEAIALAGRFFDAARNGQMDLFEQALPLGLSPNLTNDKGDSLVRILLRFELCL
jgi:hypothetical protein